MHSLAKLRFNTSVIYYCRKKLEQNETSITVESVNIVEIALRANRVMNDVDLSYLSILESVISLPEVLAPEAHGLWTRLKVLLSSIMPSITSKLVSGTSSPGKENGPKTRSKFHNIPQNYNAKHISERS